MKLIVSVGLLAVIGVAFAHHEDHSSPCGLAKYELPEGKPGCLANIKRFYHNHATGTCDEFYYDGCNKNENNFETKGECEKTCDAWHEIHKDHDHSHLKHDHSKHDHSKHDHSSEDSQHGHDHDHHHHDHAHNHQ